MFTIIGMFTLMAFKTAIVIGIFAGIYYQFDKGMFWQWGGIPIISNIIVFFDVFWQGFVIGVLLNLLIGFIGGIAYGFWLLLTL